MNYIYNFLDWIRDVMSPGSASYYKKDDEGTIQLRPYVNPFEERQ